MYKKLLVFLIPLLFLNSCEYSPTSVNYKDVSIPDPDINLVIQNGNELNVLTGSVYLSWSAELNGKEVKQMTLYLDNIKIHSTQDNPGGFLFHSEMYTNGSHVLKFELITNTGTGSLADIAGYEVYIFTREYQVQILNQT